MSIKKRYAIVGLGARVAMYVDAIADPKQFHERAELVGFCDTSRVRMAYHLRRIAEKFGHAAVTCYGAEDFERMVRETRADVVVVTTPDGWHHHYAIRAMELGCDVVVEKPLTIDAEKLNALIDAQKRTGRKIRVTHNMRYTYAASKLREIVASGRIGKPLMVDMQWMLDTAHGADYFRRWHRDKPISGGLLLHKASHHFDAVNWWIDSYPQTVFCMGELKFYGKKNAESRGEKYTYSRYTGVAEAKDDPFAFFLNTPETKGLYLDAEQESGYIRDRNVMGEPITAEDTISISAKYKNGAIFNYSLVAYCPWEGMRVAITGTKGRAELFQRHGTQFITGQTDEERAAEAKQAANDRFLRVFPMFGEPEDVPLISRGGSHGGSDQDILERIFLPELPADPLRRDATHIDGAAACLMGIAANRSIETGLPVHCDELVKLG